MKRGFTLLELIIIVIIIGILASVGLTRYFDAIEKARKSEAVGTMTGIRQIEQAYYTVNAVYMPAGTVVSNGTTTIGVDMDNDGTFDMSMVIPNSPNFTYTNTLTTIVATKKGSTKFTQTMDIATGVVTQT